MYWSDCTRPASLLACTLAGSLLQFGCCILYAERTAPSMHTALVNDIVYAYGCRLYQTGLQESYKVFPSV